MLYHDSLACIHGAWDFEMVSLATLAEAKCIQSGLATSMKISRCSQCRKCTWEKRCWERLRRCGRGGGELAEGWGQDRVVCCWVHHKLLFLHTNPVTAFFSASLPAALPDRTQLIYRTWWVLGGHGITPGCLSRSTSVIILLNTNPFVHDSFMTLFTSLQPA